MVAENNSLRAGRLVLDAEAPHSEIDRLVSGDLGDEDRLELLAWLDAEPARWRKCGLAFLEAQALREALAPRLAQASRCAAPLSRRRSALSALAAAALLSAFGLGWAAGHRPPKHDDWDSRDAQSTDSVDASQNVAAVHPVSSSRPDAPSIVGYVRVRIGEGPSAHDIRVPVIAATVGDSSWQQTPGPMPDYVRQQWERQGYRVTERRQSVPFKLADGRQVDIPVDHVTLTYVGQPLL
jgi:hypothetical protein